MQIIAIALTVLMVAFGIATFIYVAKTNKEAREVEKRIKTEENKVNETITEANNTKAGARTGNPEHDIKYMGDKLHELASK